MTDSRIEVFTRESAIAHNGSSENTQHDRNWWPRNLDETRSIKIFVYDTSNRDFVNKGLDASIKKIQETATAAYDEVSANTGNLSALITSKSFGNKSLPKELKATYHLPFPNNIQEAMQHQYSEQQGWLAQLTGLKSGEGIVGTIEATSAGIAKATGSQSYKFFENQIQMYDKSEFRSISLEWTLAPYSEDEAKEIHRIIRELKMYSSPEALGGKLLLRSPHFFGLDFNNETLQKQLQFTEVNVTDISIEYSPGGNMEMFHDDMPKTIQLSISFTDREPKLHQHWQDGYTKPPGQVGNNC